MNLLAKIFNQSSITDMKQNTTYHKNSWAVVRRYKWS